MRKVIDDWHHSLKERGMSHHTITHYVARLRDLAKWLEQERPGRTWDSVTTGDLRDFLASRMSLKPSSRGQITSAFRAFWRWRWRVTGCENIALNICLPKVRQSLPFLISPDEINKRFNMMTSSSWIEARDRAMLELCYACMLRAQEISALELHHANSENRTVHVQTKPGRTRLVPMGRKAAEALEAWLKWRGRSPGPLFLSWETKGRYPVNSIEQRIRLLSRRLGFHCDLSPDKLRQACIVHLLDNGMNLVYLAILAGHASLTTTERYERGCLKKIVAELDRIGWGDHLGRGGEKGKTGGPHPAEEG